ncbi:MAG: phosphate signaling complex protein PhoU [Gemmatimonadota bacterium]|nr:phosphate signaling complex protein PhoU [Gemmatimonadota bacterium]
MSPDGAPRRHFHDELDMLQEKLLEMASLVEHALAEATAALLDGDPSKGETIRLGDERVDELEIEIDERVIELLALQQPMAKDLRQIIATNKVSNDLERMADHAVNIARAVTRLHDVPPIPKMREFEDMIEITRGMVSDALAAYVSRNAGTARMVCMTDDRVDDLKRTIFRILVTLMLEDEKRIAAALELLLISQNLERIADLATNISEDVVFLVEGRSIKHGTRLGEFEDYNS